MHDEGLVVGHREYAPERTKLIVVMDAPVSPLGRKGTALRIAARHFEPVVWVREMRAMVTFLHGGCVLKRESLHSDYYGFLTAAKELIEDDLPDRMEAFGVTKDSSLEITVRVDLVDTPTLGYVKTEFGSRKYRAMENAVYLAGDIPDETDFFALPWEEKVGLRPVIHSAADVWSSKRDGRENAAVFDAFKKHAHADERVLGPVGSMESDVIAAFLEVA